MDFPWLHRAGYLLHDRRLPIQSGAVPYVTVPSLDSDVTIIRRHRTWEVLGKPHGLRPGII